MRGLIAIALTAVLGGCADLGYYLHNVSGHLDIMRQRVDIAELIDDPKTDAELRDRLRTAQRIRRFSVERLALPDNQSYLSYVALGRPWAVQNLFAAPEFSTRLKQWCYPIVGCAAYRGYYDVEKLDAYVAGLEAEGFDVASGRVPAYSTLGWFDDPLLSTFVHWPDYRLAGLIFHELSHQRVYIDGDTRFNESMASAVQQVGAELWLREQGQLQLIGALQTRRRYRAEVIALIETTRASLDQLYALQIAAGEKRRRKARMLADAGAAHREIAGRHAVTAGFTDWFEEGLNNARLGSVSAYNADLPAFVNLVQAHDLDFERFFTWVEKLGRLDKPRRDACLAAWATDRGADDCPALVDRN